MFDPKKIPAYLRTAVPSLWGGLIAWLVIHAPWLPAPVVEYLSGEPMVVAVSSLAILGWYSLWHWIEPRLPAWLTRIVLGSNSTPTYMTSDDV